MSNCQTEDTIGSFVPSSSFPNPPDINKWCLLAPAETKYLAPGQSERIINKKKPLLLLLLLPYVEKEVLGSPINDQVLETRLKAHKSFKSV